MPVASDGKAGYTVFAEKTAPFTVVDAEVVVAPVFVQGQTVATVDNDAQLPTRTTQVQMNNGQLVSVLAIPTGDIPYNAPVYLEAPGCVEQPRSIVIKQDGNNNKVLVLRKVHCETLAGGLLVAFLTLFTVVWNGFCVMILLSGAWQLYLLLPHSWIGWGLAYWTLCIWFNSKHISATPDEIVVIDRPINCCSSKHVVTVHDVQRFRCKRDLSYGENGGQHISFAVHLMDRTGGHKVVLASLSSAEDALFIQQELNKYYLVIHP